MTEGEKRWDDLTAELENDPEYRVIRDKLDQDIARYRRSVWFKVRQVVGKLKERGKRNGS
jgi:hypothetical protein